MSIAICGDPEVLVIEHGAEYAVGLEPDAETVVVTAGEQGPPGPPGKDAPGAGDAPLISEDPDNRLTQGSDNGLYVRDDLTPDPLAYYILAKG
ncbi:hypothetical protein [Stutzerimonas frequens]|uniref:hypothetical protein n=1 Tax=Stutzerimonas frequens TaxID=2968969 RepID=UPI00190949D9|nr:hypothetical protein [Stutzerimonas frequens]MBK3870973.1 hypothetical protein [Stutzerimonas frequens]MBK3909310.1 hypothetical protein [Stutzerimonas frequens]